MSDANVVKLLQPGSFADPLTEVLRNGARALLAQAIEVLEKWRREHPHDTPPSSRQPVTNFRGSGRAMG